MKLVPYWLDSIPPVSGTALTEFPTQADVVIIGAGFTGLSAALTLAKAGKNVVVLEADQIACHASGRNGGHVNNGTAGNFQAMVKKYGLEQAVALYRFFDDAVDTVEKIIATNNIHCDFRRCGKLKVAWTPQHLASLAQTKRPLSSMLTQRQISWTVKPLRLRSVGLRRLKAVFCIAKAHRCMWENLAVTLHPKR